MLDIKGK